MSEAETDKTSDKVLLIMHLPINKSGFALFISIFIILAFSTIALLCFNLLTVQDDAAIRNLYSIRAYYLAEAARQLWLEYYPSWGNDFTNTTQFPDGTTRTLNGGQFSFSYISRNSRLASLNFTGSIPLGTTTVTKGFRQDFSDSSSALFRDLNNFVLGVFNDDEVYALGGDNPAEGRYYYTYGCACAQGCSTTLNQRYIFRAFGNVYLDGPSSSPNGRHLFKLGEIGYPNDPSKPRELYITGKGIGSGVLISECTRIYGNLRITNAYLHHHQLESGGFSKCRLNVVSSSPYYCVNPLDPPNVCDGSCYSGAAGTLPQPAKPDINTYFTQELQLAQNCSSGGYCWNGNGIAGPTTLTKNVYYSGSDDFYLTGDINVIFPINIVINLTNATKSVRIQSGAKVSGKITIISSGKIVTYGDEIRVGDINLTCPSSLIYSHSDANPAIEINASPEIKANILSRGSVDLAEQQTPKIWGTIYAWEIDAYQAGQANIYGPVFVDQTEIDKPLNLTLNEAPLSFRIRGLYNIASSNWQEQ
ncbi:MAG: hypothetical protein V1674_00175 [Candidatus Omnitrophota bacterium]